MALAAAQAHDTGTGPYRRVWSQTGFTVARASIYLPSTADGSAQYSGGDQGYIYFGGFGVNGQELDAGLQHNPTTDSWALFINAQGRGMSTSQGSRLAGGQTVTMTFSIQGDGSFLLEVSGNAVQVLGVGNVNPLGAQDLTYSVPGVAGFPPDGIGVSVKRTTSIAQKPEAQGNGSKLSGVRWSNVQHGTSVGALQSWVIAGTWEYWNTGIAVAYVDDTEETVSVTA